MDESVNVVSLDATIRQYNLTVLCETAAYLSNNIQLRVALRVHVAITIIGLLLFAILFKLQRKYLAVHPNARMLLISHHIWVILQCTTDLISHIFALRRYSIEHVNPCDYLITSVVSVLVRGPLLFCLYGQVWALSAMAIERLCATIYYKDYEKKKNRLAKVLVPIQVRNLQLLFLPVNFYRIPVIGRI
jgi:hypothetical protein